MKLKNKYYFFILLFVQVAQGNNMPEKVFFKNSKGLALAGSLWHAPSSENIVIMTHGSGSNRLAHGLFTSVGKALQKGGYNVLAFDFSGHGESDDAIFSLKQSVEDVASAITFAKEQGYKKIALIGHSIGAYACLKNAQHVEAMILIGGLTGPVEWSWEGFCTPEQLEGLVKTGYVHAEVNDGLRKALKIDGNLIDDLKKIDQQKLFSTLKFPILMIHGDADSQERDLLAISKKAESYLHEESSMMVVEGADHTFVEHSDEVINLIKKWLKLFFSQ